MKPFISFYLIFFPCIIFAQQAGRDTFYLFFLGGQSNMEGYGFNDQLPDGMQNSYSEVFIFNGNAVADGSENGGLGLWAPLKPGHGAGFSSNGIQNNLSDRFGLELTLAITLKQRYRDKKIAFIKYARGGSSLDSLAARYFGSWEPEFKGKGGVNQYDHFLNTINNAFAIEDINSDGILDVLIPKAIFWMQGEGDAEVLKSSALNYEQNLSRLICLMRKKLGEDNLPVVIGKISDSGRVWPFGKQVMQAQEDYVLKDKNAAIVRSTQHYAYSDPWHYDSQGYMDLGMEFARAFIQLYEMSLKK
jgi:hypothetical protein